MVADRRRGRCDPRSCQSPDPPLTPGLKSGLLAENGRGFGWIFFFTFICLCAKEVFHFEMMVRFEGSSVHKGGKSAPVAFADMCLVNLVSWSECGFAGAPLCPTSPPPVGGHLFLKFGSTIGLAKADNPAIFGTFLEMPFLALFG